MRRELRGYNVEQVNLFLSRCLATPGVCPSEFPEIRGNVCAGDRVTEQDLQDVQFDEALLGYPIRTVDALLRRIETSLSSPALDEPDLVIDLTSTVKAPEKISERAYSSARG